LKPQGKSRHESLYFDYPDFAFAHCAELDGAQPLHPVLIAGAGPVGLVAAIALALRGVRSVVIDEKSSVSDGSRAICISRYSFETLQQLGVVGPFLDKALGWTHGRCYFRDREFYRMQMPHSDDERYLPMYNIQQQYIEKFLVDAARQYPELIDLRWRSRVSAVQARADQVCLTVDTEAGSYRLIGRYLLAADGARSQVRKQLGLELAGSNLPGDYVIVDIKMQHDFPTERRSFFESAARPGATILIHRQPEDIWRLDYQLREDEDREEAMREQNIRASVQAILEVIGHRGDWELEWWSIYTANTLCLDDYRHGPVLFIGDSAHIVPIFGVRGLNNGIADAVNAAWKLACVIHGQARGDLLASYSPERRGATLDVFANAGKSARFMTPPTRGHALLRRAVLELAQTEEFCKRFADPRQVQPYTYARSPLTAFAERDREFTAGPRAGASLLNCRIAASDFLLDHLGEAFSALLFCHDSGEAASLVRHLADICGPALRLIVIAPHPVPVPGAEVVIDEHGRLAAAHGAVDGSLYLLRPDRHIAARWLRVDLDEVRLAFGQALGGMQP